MRELKGHRGPVHSLAFYPEGHRLWSAAGKTGRRVSLWEIAEGEHTELFDFSTMPAVEGIAMQARELLLAFRWHFGVSVDLDRWQSDDGYEEHQFEVECFAKRGIDVLKTSIYRSDAGHVVEVRNHWTSRPPHHWEWHCQRTPLFRKRNRVAPATGLTASWFLPRDEIAAGLGDRLLILSSQQALDENGIAVGTDDARQFDNDITSVAYLPGGESLLVGHANGMVR